MAHVAPREFEDAGNMEELLSLLGRAGIENGWAKREPSMYAKPKKAFIPAQWEWAQARAALDAAGRFVNTELAERRNLILNNPVPGNFYPTVTTLVSAYQMVKAGEVARSHRHTANALRFVAQAEPGMYTVVDGKKIPMEPSAAQGRGEVVDDHGLGAPFGLGALAGIVNDEGIEVGQGAKGPFRKTLAREA
jgi:gentisate 1,2-dioxygenase